MNPTKRAQLDYLEAQRKEINDEFDVLCYRSERGIDIDMVRWYQLIAQIKRVEEKIGLLMVQDGIDRADAIIEDLHQLLDPFEPGDSLPEIEPEYDPYLEWHEMTSALRRGEG